MITRGILLALVAAVISGFSIFISAYGVKEFPSAGVYAGLRNTIVGLALLSLMLRPSSLQELRRLTPRQGLGLALLGVIGGSIPFVLFFEGLRRIDSGNGAFIQKTLFVWVAVLAVIFLRERLGLGQILALGMLLVANLILGGPDALQPGAGEIMVLSATLLWSIEVILAKRLLASVSSGLGATARMGIGAVILLGYLSFTGQLGFLGQLTATQWAWALGPSVLLFGYVVTWYAALKRAPATTVTCVLTVGAPITAVLSALMGKGLRPEEAFGYGIMVVAVLAFALLPLRKALRGRKDVQAVARGGV